MNDRDEFQQFKDYQEWLKQTEYYKEYEKHPMQPIRKSMNIPKEWVFAGCAAAAAIVLTAWPILVLGIIIGLFIQFKFRGS